MRRFVPSRVLQSNFVKLAKPFLGNFITLLKQADGKPGAAPFEFSGLAVCPLAFYAVFIW